MVGAAGEAMACGTSLAPPGAAYRPSWSPADAFEGVRAVFAGALDAGRQLEASEASGPCQKVAAGYARCPPAASDSPSGTCPLASAVI